MLTKLEKKVTNRVCATEIGVGLPTVIAVRKMLGIGGARKVFVSPILEFLRRYGDFRIADAEDLYLFKARHPEFRMPNGLQDRPGQ